MAFFAVPSRQSAACQGGLDQLRVCEPLGVLLCGEALCRRAFVVKVLGGAPRATRQVDLVGGVDVVRRHDAEEPDLLRLAEGDNVLDSEAAEVGVDVWAGSCGREGEQRSVETLCAFLLTLLALGVGLCVIRGYGEQQVVGYDVVRAPQYLFRLIVTVIIAAVISSR